MILGINGSPRKKGTLFLLSEALHAASEAGAETKLISLADYDIKPCDACNKCVKEKVCSISDDMEKIGEMLIEARAIIVGSPCYFSSPPALLKNFIDRTRILKMQGHRLKNKLFACVITSGLIHGGAENVIKTLHEFALAHGMLIVGACGDAIKEPWHVIATMQKSEGWQRITEDKIAINAARNLGRRLAELSKNRK